MPRRSRANRSVRVRASHKREGEHAAQVLDAALAPLAPGVRDDLGVGARAEAVAERAELGAQRGEVVDLAVEDDGDVADAVAHRLAAAVEVDERQAGVAERDRAVAEDADVVGAAVGEACGHPLDERGRDEAAVEGEGAGDAAHDGLLCVAVPRTSAGQRAPAARASATSTSAAAASATTRTTVAPPSAPARRASAPTTSVPAPTVTAPWTSSRAAGRP